MQDVDGAKQAQLNKKKHLVRLKLSFDSEEKEEEAEKWKSHDEELLEAFQHFSYLEKLEISGYLGTKTFSSWFLSLNHLTKLTLCSWKNCDHLPPLGKLLFLKHLELKSMKVKKVGLEFSGIETSGSSDTLPPAVAFPKLETLKFRGFREWKEWDMDDLHGSMVMPSLTYLRVDNCVILKALPDILLNKTTLKHLSIWGCPLLREHFQKHRADWSKISHISNLMIY